MDIVNILDLNYKSIMDADFLFIKRNVDEHDTSRYLKIFNTLFQIGYFISTRMKSMKPVKLPNNIKAMRDLLYGYMDTFYNEKNIYWNILQKFIKNKTKLSRKQLKEIYNWITYKIKGIHILIENYRYDQYTKASKNSFCAKFITIYSIYILSVNNYSV